MDIDTGLSDVGSVLKPAAIGADVAIGDGAGVEPLATISNDGKSLSLDWPRDLDAPQIEGDEATFADTASRDVQVTATPTGFNVHVVLAEVPATAPVYRLPITAKGVTVVKRAGGSFDAVDKDGNVVFTIDAPTMWDSNPATMTEAGQSVRVPVDTELATVDGRQELRLLPSMQWLSDSARILPIFVDPDVSTQNSARDAYIREGNPDSTAASTPYINTGWGGSTVKKQRAFIQHAALPTIPAGAQIVRGELELRQWDAATCTPIAMNVYPVTAAWSSSITWNTRPGYSTSTCRS